MTLLIRGPDLSHILADWFGCNPAKGEFREEIVLDRGDALVSFESEEDLHLVVKEAVGSNSNRAEDVFNSGFEKGGTMNGLGETERGEDATIGVESVGLGEGMDGLGEG